MIRCFQKICSCTHLYKKQSQRPKSTDSGMQAKCYDEQLFTYLPANK